MEHYRQVIAMKKQKINKTPSVDPIIGEPITSFDLINKYGTYNIQPTCDTQNEYPNIAQGLSEKAVKESLQARDQWLEEQQEQVKKAKP